MSYNPTLGIISGYGWYNFNALEAHEIIEIKTPFGEPSAPITVGKFQDKQIAFLPRHGLHHQITDSDINSRANVYALKSLGVERIIGLTACESLRNDYAPGDLVIPDQLVDFTHNRANTFFNNGITAKVNLAEPFCNHLATEVYQAIIQTDAVVHLGGTLLTIDHPRSTTTAESHLFRAWGISLLNRSTCPEVFLAREAQICYTTLAHIMDYDSWNMKDHLSQQSARKIIEKSNRTIKKALEFLLESLPEDLGCQHRNALSDAIITDMENVDPTTRENLSLFFKQNDSQ